MAQATQQAKAKEAAGTDTIVVRFTLEKQTKNAIRYQEDGTDGENRGKIGTLYVQKSALPTTPEQIEVSIRTL